MGCSGEGSWDLRGSLGELWGSLLEPRGMILDHFWRSRESPGAYKVEMLKLQYLTMNFDGFSGSEASKNDAQMASKPYAGSAGQPDTLLRVPGTPLWVLDSPSQGPGPSHPPSPSHFNISPKSDPGRCLVVLVGAGGCRDLDPRLAPDPHSYSLLRSSNIEALNNIFHTP